MEVYKSDLFNIGFFEEDPNEKTLVILENGSGSYVTKIILREILKLWGYEITREDTIVSKSRFMLGCYTDMPWEVFEKSRKEFRNND